MYILLFENISPREMKNVHININKYVTNMLIE